MRNARPELPEIEDLDGNPVSLADFAGDKPVLVEFWALWCSDCEKLHPSLAAAHEAYGDRMEFVAVGVGINQNPRRIKRHLDGMDPPVEWPTYYDARGAAARAFLAPTTSYIVILDRSGRVVYANVGPNQNIDGAIRSALGAPDSP